MTQQQMDDLKAVSVKICLQGHLYAIDLGEKFGPPFKEHDTISYSIQEIFMMRDPQEVLKLVDSNQVKSMIDAVQDHEERVLASICGHNPDLDAEEILRYATRFDQELLAYWGRAYAARVMADEPSPMDKVNQELARRGIGDQVVAAMSKRDLRERIHDRKLRRKWLRTSEGQEYLLGLARRRRRHHHQLDRQKSKTAKLASKLYQNER